MVLVGLRVGGGVEIDIEVSESGRGIGSGRRVSLSFFWGGRVLFFFKYQKFNKKVSWKTQHSRTPLTKRVRVLRQKVELQMKGVLSLNAGRTK